VRPPVLGEDAVVLRGLRPGDAADLVELAADRDVQRWLPQPPAGSPATSLTAALAGERAAQDLVVRAQRGWDAGTWLALAVEVEGRFAGVLELHPQDAGGARVTGALAPGARGLGAASGALRLLLTWGFAELGLQVVHARGEVGAWAARRAAWACGFAVEGTVRDLLVRDGERRDAWVASLRWEDPLRPRHRWLDAVPLAGHGVRLGPHAPDDVSRTTQACAQEDTQRWLPSLPAPYTVLDAVAHLAACEEQQARGTAVHWAVRGAGGGDQLGEVGLFRLGGGARSAEVGYWCHPDARGRGVTTAAVRLVARHALGAAAGGGLGLERLVLLAARDNAASRRVAVKAGFTEVGVDRLAERLRDGTRTDFIRYDLLATEMSTEMATPVSTEA